MRLELNLSTRPFPPYRLWNGLLLIALLALLATSYVQVLGFTRYSSLASDLSKKEQEVRVEFEGLAGRLTSLQTRMNRPEATAQLQEIQFLNELIVRRSFSWIRIFSELESLVPPSVHLVSLRPEIQPDASVALQLEVRGRTIPDVSALIDALEQSPAFEGVVVSTEERRDRSIPPDVEVRLTVRYLPQASPGSGGNR